MASEHVFTLLLVITMFNYVKSIYSIYSFGNLGTLFRYYYICKYIIYIEKENRNDIIRDYDTFL